MNLLIYLASAGDSARIDVSLISALQEEKKTRKFYFGLGNGQW